MLGGFNGSPGDGNILPRLRITGVMVVRREAATEAKRSKLSSKEGEKQYLAVYILEIFWSKAKWNPWLSVIKLYVSLNIWWMSLQ